MKAKITFLGTGTSTGVPEIGCRCKVCTSNDKRDKRLRTSALIETSNQKLLIDCGPDFRQQMICNNIKTLDGTLLTHEHYDHVGGLDDLRPFCARKPADIYAEENVLQSIRTRMPYAFGEHFRKGMPELLLHKISTEQFRIAELDIIPIRAMHGSLPILGFRIGNIAFITDIKTIPEQEYHKLKDIQILAIGALRKREHPTHQSLADALRQVERIKPEKTYLIHISHHFGLHAVEEPELPEGVHIAFDGMTIEA